MRKPYGGLTACLRALYGRRGIHQFILIWLHGSGGALGMVWDPLGPCGNHFGMIWGGLVVLWGSFGMLWAPCGDHFGPPVGTWSRKRLTASLRPAYGKLTEQSPGTRKHQKSWLNPAKRLRKTIKTYQNAYGATLRQLTGNLRRKTFFCTSCSSLRRTYGHSTAKGISTKLLTAALRPTYGHSAARVVFTKTHPKRPHSYL